MWAKGKTDLKKTNKKYLPDDPGLSNSLFPSFESVADDERASAESFVAPSSSISSASPYFELVSSSRL